MIIKVGLFGRPDQHPETRWACYHDLCIVLLPRFPGRAAGNVTPTQPFQPILILCNVFSLSELCLLYLVKSKVCCDLTNMNQKINKWKLLLTQCCCILPCFASFLTVFCAALLLKELNLSNNERGKILWSSME